MPGALGKVALCLPMLLLVGCQSSSNSTPVLNPPATISTNAVLFDPTADATAFVPLPNILATAAAADPLAGRAANSAMTPPEALAYVNQYEMGGTQAVSGVNAPIYLRFTYPVASASVKPATVKVFQITADSASPSATENKPLGFTDVSALFTYQLAANGLDLQLFPNFPLLPATRYVYVVTDQVLDQDTGGAVIPSVYFNLLKSPTPLTGAYAALEPVRANTMAGSQIALSGYAKTMGDLVTAAKATGINSVGEIALLGRFITSGAGYLVTNPASAATSTIPVESAIRAFAAAGIPGTPLQAVIPDWSNAVTVNATYTATTGLSAAWSAIFTAEGVPAAAQPAVPSTLGTIITGTLNSANLALDPVVVAAHAGSQDLTVVAPAAYAPAYEAGVVQSFRQPTTGQWLGYYYTTTPINYLYFAPAGAAPKGGWPLVIYQHGIGSSKESVLALAQALTGAGFAAVAIDLPLHNSLAIPTHATPTQWVEDFLAIGAPLSTRSNIQQAAFNLHRLELSVETGGFAAAMGANAPAAAMPEFAGISLGSIVGAYYLAGNTQLDTTLNTFTAASVGASMKGYLSVPGGRLAYLIQNSPDFAPVVNAGLAALPAALGGPILPGTPSYNQFFLLTQSVVDIADPATMTTPVSGTTVSRLAGRLVVEEDTNSYDASGNMLGGDLVIPNAYTRYFGNALGGDLMFEAEGLDIAPTFGQVGYGGPAAAPTVPSQFMFGLTASGLVADTFLPSKTVPYPSEGYFQFNQAGVSHGALLAPATAAALPVTAAIQEQMVYFLAADVVVDTTPSH